STRPRRGRGTRHPPYLLGELGQRDQREIGIAEHGQRGDGAAEHADLEAEMLRGPDRDRVIDRAGMDAPPAGEDRTQFFTALTIRHRTLLSSLRGAKRR